MCGIVGAVAQRNITPILIEGLKRLEYRGYDSCGVALHRRRPAAALAQHRARGGTGSAGRLDRTGRLHRHRPHPLGHPRRALFRQCPSALLAGQRQCAHRAGAQRHHRKPRRIARRTARARLCVREPDRHRSHRPPGRPHVYRRPVRHRAAGGQAAATARMRSRCSAATNRTAWSARARARR